MKGKIIIILALLFLIPIALAQEDNNKCFVFEQNDIAFNFSFQCFTNTLDYCQPATQLLLNLKKTSQTGSSDLILNNHSLTGNPTFFNVSLPVDNTGEYRGLIISPGSSFNDSEFCYLVTPSGISPSESRTEAIGRPIWFFLIFSVITLIATILVKSYPIKLTLAMGSIMLILVTVNMMFISLQDEVINPTILGFIEFITIASYIIFRAGFVVIAIIWIITFIVAILERKKFKKRKEYGF